MTEKNEQVPSVGDEKFETFKELLSNFVLSHQWSNAFCLLVDEVWWKRREAFEDVWLPYGEKHAELNGEPIVFVRSLDHMKDIENVSICDVCF